MSELKAYTFSAMERAGLADYYLKSEADKVIADLEESHKMEVEQLLIEIAELKAKLAAAQQVLRLNKPEALYSNLDTMGRLKHEIDVAARRERHHKYKRCLAMARIAQDDWHLHNSFYAMGHQEFEKRKCEFYDKWRQRWLKLAQKFKEAK